MGETDQLSVTLTDVPVCDLDHIFEVAVKTPAGTGPYVTKDVREGSGIGK